MAHALTRTDFTVRDHAEDWFRRAQPRLKRRTRVTYRFVLDHYVLPLLGAHALAALRRPDVLRWAAELRARERALSAGSVQLALTVLSMLLNDAAELELIGENPAARLVRRVARGRRRATRAYTEEQLALFLEAAPAAVGPELALLYAVYGRAGLRVGEGRALQGTDVDLARRTILVERQIHRDDGSEDTPKDHQPRVVDLAASLHARLAPIVHARRGWLFPFALETRAYKAIREGMEAVAGAAGIHRLPPISLRHSFASILLERGESEAYVQEQLGHADPRTTKIYSRHFRVRRARSMDEL